jgi:hypothetical protein
VCEIIYIFLKKSIYLLFQKNPAEKQQDLGVEVGLKSHLFFAILALSLWMDSSGPQKKDYD